jgi:hypothetical protein
MRFVYCAARAEKAKALFPRPAAGPLRPVVRGQTIKYNSKQKLGRGFSLEELKVGSMEQGELADELDAGHRQQLCSYGCCAAATGSRAAGGLLAAVHRSGWYPGTPPLCMQQQQQQRQQQQPPVCSHTPTSPFAAAPAVGSTHYCCRTTAAAARMRQLGVALALVAAVLSEEPHAAAALRSAATGFVSLFRENPPHHRDRYAAKG